MLMLLFKTGAAKLTSDHRARLKEALPDLQQSGLIVISARTDIVGSEPANQALSLARGLAVRDHLLDLEPDLPARITIDARGRCCYAASNDTPTGRTLNRRVEVTFAPIDRTAP